MPNSNEGARLVLLGVAGVGAALVALFLLGPNDDVPTPATQMAARPAIRFGGGSAGATVVAVAVPGTAASTAPGVAEATPSATSIGTTPAVPALDAHAVDAAAARQQSPALRARRVESANAASESAPRVPDDREVSTCWVAVSNLPDMYYAIARDERQVWNGSSSARLFAFDDRAQHGMLQQTVSAAAFAGKRLEFSAYLKTESAILGVKVWLIAVDAGGRVVAESGTDWLRGTLDWHRQAIVGDIPADAAAITLAFRVLGTGALWVDDAAVATVARHAGAAAVGTVTPNRGLLPNPQSTLPPAPQNLDFEDWQGEVACDGPPAG